MPKTVNNRTKAKMALTGAQYSQITTAFRKNINAHITLTEYLWKTMFLSLHFLKSSMMS